MKNKIIKKNMIYTVYSKDKDKKYNEKKNMINI